MTEQSKDPKGGRPPTPRPPKPPGPGAPEPPEAPQPQGKPGGRLARNLGEYGQRPAAPPQARAFAATSDPAASQAGPRDLATECDRRGIEVNEEERAYLASPHWSPEVAEQLMTLIETCEQLGVPFELDFDHRGPEAIQVNSIQIRMQGH